MASWNEILDKFGQMPSPYDAVRREYISRLSTYTGRNTILYYSAWLQKSLMANGSFDFGINDNDKTGFMTCIYKMDKTKGLDLILHTLGGDISATESLVVYLKSIFGNDIRVIIPQMAMSAGTMIACCAKEIIMGKHSNLGPIDPQYGMYRAHGIIEEFNSIKQEFTTNPNASLAWGPILSKYTPTLIGECQKAIDWSNGLVEQWLTENMFSKDPAAVDKAKAIVDYIGSHALTKSHSRHLHMKDLQNLGLKITELENDAALQDLVLSIHHSTIITFGSTKAAKIIENQNGISFINTIG